MKKEYLSRDFRPKLDVIVEWKKTMWKGLGPERVGHSSLKESINGNKSASGLIDITCVACHGELIVY